MVRPYLSSTCIVAHHVHLVEGSFYCAREAAKDMMRREAPGSIVMIGSMSGAAVNVPQPQAPYNASKAAVRHMASSLAVEWAQRNIRVNVISPGYMAVSSIVSLPPAQS
jgi:D-arabinitol 2-dehydrogenase